MSNVLDALAPFLGLIFLPSTTQVLLELAPFLGLSSLPSQSHVFEEEALFFGLISLPSHIQVLDDEAPLFGFSSRPSQTQLFGKSISKLMVSLSLVKNCHLWNHKVTVSQFFVAAEYAIQALWPAAAGGYEIQLFRFSYCLLVCYLTFSIAVC